MEVANVELLARKKSLATTGDKKLRSFTSP
jgi:hypothetical protein